MIDLNFGLFWSGAPMSYLRYLTFKTLRHFHPHSRIILFTSSKFRKNKNGQRNSALQEFDDNSWIKTNYMEKLEKLGVEIVNANISNKYYPYQQADFFRWSFLRHDGGIYLDPDQIILKSFKSLPLKDYKFLYSSYKISSPFALNGEFTPIGVLGASRDSNMVKHVSSVINNYFEENNYNSIGVLMMNAVLKNIDLSEAFNAPPDYFYPIPICDRMKGIFDGSFEIKDDSFALHWYGGYDPSQTFNRSYTEEFAKTSNDSISKWLRKNKII